MKISVRARAFTVDAASGREIAVPPALDGWRCDDSRLADYLDPPIADLGLVGGVVRAEIVSGRATIVVDFWSPHALDSDALAELEDFVSAQLRDGFGENGFEIHDARGDALLVADLKRPLLADQIDDGREVQPASRLVIAARDGDLDALRNAIDARDDLNAKLQGHDALQMAILYGHGEAAELLISAGADVNKVDSLGNTVLGVCALSRSLSDTDSARIAMLLLQAGADPMRKSSHDRSAIELAEARGKFHMAAVLRGSVQCQD